MSVQISNNPDYKEHRIYSREWLGRKPETQAESKTLQGHVNEFQLHPISNKKINTDFIQGSDMIQCVLER